MIASPGQQDWRLVAGCFAAGWFAAIVPDYFLMQGSVILALRHSLPSSRCLQRRQQYVHRRPAPSWLLETTDNSVELAAASCGAPPSALCVPAT